MTILYFTATGNSLAVAKKQGGERLSIPRRVKEMLSRIGASAAASAPRFAPRTTYL